MTHDVSQRWRISYDLHIIRSAEYKGSKLDTSQVKIRLPLTLAPFLGSGSVHFGSTIQLCRECSPLHTAPSVLGLTKVASVLQVRSCIPKHQEAALQAMDLFITHACPPDLRVPLLPNVET